MRRAAAKRDRIDAGLQQIAQCKVARVDLKNKSDVVCIRGQVAAHSRSLAGLSRGRSCCVCSSEQRRLMIELRLARYWLVQWFKLANAMTAWWLSPMMINNDGY